MSTSAPSSRRVTRVQLGLLLRDWRERRGLSSKEAAEALEWYTAKMSKLEKGGVTISAAELGRLIDLYDVEREDAERIRTLGRDARKRGSLGRVPEWARTYAELEQGADEIRLYDGELIPGLLQSEDYARALLETSIVTAKEDAEARAEERVQRRTLLTGANPPRLWVVLGEAALHRLVGGAAVLRGQLQLLRDMARLPQVTLQILPFEAGEHVALGVQFCILGFTDPPATFVYLEALADADYLDRPSQTEIYTLAFDRVLVAAATERDSKRMLDRRIRDLD